MLNKLVPSILGWMVVVIVLALSPTIVTYNSGVTSNVTAATNAAYMIGMTVVDDFAGFIIIMGLLFSGGWFAISGMRNKNTTMKDMVGVIGAVVLTVLSLAIFGGTVIGYFDALITAAAAGFEKTAYGILPVIIYIGIIAGGAAYTAVTAWRKGKGKKSSASMGGL